MPVDSMKEMERTPYSSPETLRVRCPHCRKLYLVQYGDIQEAKPRFECVQCRQRFWLAMQEVDAAGELTGLPMEVKQAPEPPRVAKSSPVVKPAVPRELEPCPKCFKLNEPGRNECGHCGVVISKFKNAFQIQDNFPPHSPHLEAQWHKVLADYGNEKTHDDFMGLCQKENNFAYAAALYTQMVRLMPGDEVSGRRLTAIQRLGEAMLPPRPQLQRLARRMPRVWQVPLAAGVMLMVVGMSSPVFRNMAGVGAAFLFFAVMLQLQMRRR